MGERGDRCDNRRGDRRLGDRRGDRYGDLRIGNRGDRRPKASDGRPRVLETGWRPDRSAG